MREDHRGLAGGFERRNHVKQERVVTVSGRWNTVILKSPKLVCLGSNAAAPSLHRERRISHYEVFRPQSLPSAKAGSAIALPLAIPAVA